MQQPVELEIRRLLLEKKSAGAIVKMLLDSESFILRSEQERNQILHFTLAAGFKHTMSKLAGVWFKSSGWIHWNPFLRLLAENDFYPTNEFTESLLTGLKVQNQIHQVLPLRSWDDYIPELAVLRSQTTEDYHKAFEQKRQDLRDRLVYARSQQMLGEEQQILQRLQKMFPDDPGFREEAAAFQERWARNVISRASFEIEETLADRTPLTADEKAWIKVLKKEIKSKAKKKPDTLYSLSLLFYFMELFEEALEILPKKVNSESLDWYKLELLTKTERLIDALSAVNEIERRHPDRSDVTLATTYARAQILWRLGQHNLAIDLMKSIISIRPDYRSAQALLNEWLEGQR